MIFQGFATIALLLAHAPFISYQFLHRTSYCSSRILRPLKIFKDSFNVSGKCTFSAIDFYQMAKCSYHSYKHPPNSAQCSQCSKVIFQQSGTDRSNWPPPLKYLKYLSSTINNEHLNSRVTFCRHQIWKKKKWHSTITNRTGENNLLELNWRSKDPLSSALLTFPHWM